MVENHNVERTQSYQLRIVRVERDRAVEWDSTDPSWQIYKSLFRFGQQIILVKFPAELNKFTNGIAWRISSQLDIWPRHDALCWRLVNEELKSTSAFLLRNRVETIRSSEGERGGERERERDRAETSWIPRIRERCMFDAGSASSPEPAILWLRFPQPP